MRKIQRFICAIALGLLVQVQGEVIFHDTFQAGNDTAPNADYALRQTAGLITAGYSLTIDGSRTDNTHRILDRNSDGESALALNVCKPIGGVGSWSWTASRPSVNFSSYLDGNTYSIKLDSQFASAGGNPAGFDTALAVGILGATSPTTTPMTGNSLFGIHLNGTGGGFSVYTNGVLAFDAVTGSSLVWNERFSLELVVDEVNSAVQVLLQGIGDASATDMGTYTVDFESDPDRILQTYGGQTDNGSGAGGVLAIDLFDLKVERSGAVNGTGDAAFVLEADLADLPADGIVELLGESAADSGERWRLALEGSGTNRNLIFEMRIDGDPELVQIVQQRFLDSHPKAPATMLADAEAGLFRVSAPLHLIGSGPHKVILRLVPPVWTMDFFVDGVLMDEEWPLGAMVKPGTALAPHELVSSFSLEACTVTDEQIIARNGEENAVAKRTVEVFGADVNVPPYFRTRGFNTQAGDAAPMFDGERVHLYYLKARDHGLRRWGLGGAYVYGHLSSADLVHWTKHPDAVPLTRPYEGGIWTGSFIKTGDDYIGFLHNWMISPWLGRYNVQLGVRMVHSTDGIHFDLSGEDRPVPGIYESAGDPDIFEMEDGRYGLLGRGDRDGNRQVFLHTSKDLEHWTEEPLPFGPVPDNGDCPHCFRFDGRWYLFVANHARTAESFTGSWVDIPASSLAVPKTVPFKNGRCLIVGTVTDGGWGGDSVFHELVGLPDGSLGEKFVPEMTPLSGNPMALAPNPWLGMIEVNGAAIAVGSNVGLAAAVVDNVPQLARIRMTVCPTAGSGSFGLAFRGTENGESETALIFDPLRETVAYGSFNGSDMTVEQGGNQFGTNDLELPFFLDVILGPNGLVDVEINGQRCITTRGSKNPDDNHLFLFSEDGNVVFENIEIRPWIPIASDGDLDGDGWSDAYEQANGLNPYDAFDMAFDSGTVVVDQKEGSVGWHNVEFSHAFDEAPVVVMGPPGYVGPDPCTMRIRSITANGFECQLDEWDYRDGYHAPETVGWLAVRSGRYTVDGSEIEAFFVDNVTEAGFDSIIDFAAPFPSIPVVLSQTTTCNDPSAVTTRLKDITTSSFRVRVQEEQAADGSHSAETVSIIALETGQTPGFATGISSLNVNQDWRPVTFGDTYENPVLLGNIQTFQGPDPAALRYTSLTSGGVDVKCEEEQSADSETEHADESVGWAVFLN